MQSATIAPPNCSSSSRRRSPRLLQLLYLGSANWTGAGLGAKGTGRRNFELGFSTDDDGLLDRVQELYARIWNGAECGGCKLRDVCPAPLDGGGSPAGRPRPRPPGAPKGRETQPCAS